MTAPFGIEIGQALNSELIIAEGARGKFAVRPNRPHPDFVEYFVQASPSYGVVWVKGVSSPVENDAYGRNVRTIHERISTQLQSKYGKPEKADLLAHDSIWGEDRDWVMGLLQNERHYFHLWSRAKGASIPPDLDSVFLGLLPHSGSDCSVILEYASSNLELAEAEADQNLSDLL